MNPDIESEMRENLSTLEKQHLKKLDQIKKIVLCDTMTKVVDEEYTQVIRQKDRESEVAAYRATINGIQAFERLLNFAETRDSGQIRYIAQFLAGVWGADGGIKLDCLKSLDKAIGDDMLAVLDAVRWNQLPVHQMAVRGPQRVPAALRKWGYSDI